jgi:hypothetical protein
LKEETPEIARRKNIIEESDEEDGDTVPAESANYDSLFGNISE